MRRGALKVEQDTDDNDDNLDDFIEPVDGDGYDSKDNDSDTEGNTEEFTFYKVETEKELKRIEELKQELDYKPSLNPNINGYRPLPSDVEERIRQKYYKNEDKIDKKLPLPIPEDLGPMTKKKKYYCDICNFSSDKRRNVAIHVKLSKTHSRLEEVDKSDVYMGQDGIQYFSCKNCTFVTKRKDNYQRHITYVHSEVRPFQCQKCSYAGKSKEHLQQHAQGHEQAFHFECSNCDKSLRSKESLKYHKMNVCTEAYFYKVENDPEENILRKPTYPKRKKHMQVKEEQQVTSTTEGFEESEQDFESGEWGNGENQW